jgi:CxxC motif-containing protein
MKTVFYTCIICPKSCGITVHDNDGKLSIEGHECKKGLAYAENEHLNPVRMLTSTVRLRYGNFKRLGVVGTKEISKSQMGACLTEIYKVTMDAPVKCGDIVIKNICGTGCDVVAAMTMRRKSA